MNTPKISVVMPVYNVEDCLEQALNCMMAQTFTDFELICVDDGSTDRSVSILNGFAEKDDRLIILKQKNAGAGAARNLGMAEAKGEYIIFLDSDDLFSPALLEKAYAAITENDADICAFNFSCFQENGEVEQRKGIHTEWLPKGTLVFNYADCPGLIMSIINPTPWNKIYRKEFIICSNLKFEEISSSNDITFAAVSAAAAKRITYIEDSLVRYRIGHAGTITSTKSKKLDNVITAVNSAVRQAKQLPYSDSIKKSIQRFAIENCIVALKRNVVDFSDLHAREFYLYVHAYFNSPEFTDLEISDLNNDDLFISFCTVKKHDYDAMRKLIARKIIVSLTTYPARIGTLSQVLETVYEQTRQADEVILWLAEEQFPNQEGDLPEDLLQLVAENRLTIRWCDDLKPHKKYFYSLQEYSEDLVVTLDDDLLYEKDLIEKLYRSYLLYPNAVSAARAHLIVLSEDGKILSYQNWVKETDGCLYQPCMQLLATGGAGTLYPPHLIRKEMFDKEAVMTTCLWADDLWLKAMELVSGVPVVVSQPFSGLKYLPGSQVEALCHQNVDHNQNDIQLEQIICWLNSHIEQDIFTKVLMQSEIGVRLIGIEAVCNHFSLERINYRKKINLLNTKLYQTYAEKSAINAKLKQTYAEKSELNVKLQRTYSEKSEINAKLKQTYKEKAERGVKIKELEEEIARLNRELEAARTNSLVLKIRNVLRRVKNELLRH